MPKPLSGIAQKVLPLIFRTAEKPGIGWPGNGGVTPLFGATAAPEGGPSW